MYISFKLKSLLSGLLHKSPTHRLTIQSIKSHPWFSKICFPDLLNFSIPPPYIPKLKTPTDTSHFDTDFTQCEVDSFGDNTEMGEDWFEGFEVGKEKRRRSASVETQEGEEL